MASIGDVELQLLLNDSRFQADVVKAGEKGGKAAGQTMGQSITSGFKRNAGRIFGVGGGAIFAGAIESAVALEDQLRTIQTVVPDLDLSKVEDDIQALSRETGKTTDDLTAGFYDLVSAGVPAEQAIAVLRDSAKFATGALGTTAESVDLVTSALNAYGLGADSSARITDIFAKAVADGKVTASELGASIANIAPIAASAGVSLEEVSAGYALLTAKGVPAAQAATQMRAAISALLTPNKQLNDLQKETGINFAELAKEEGLAVALEAVRKATNGNNDAFAKSLGSIEAYQFALATTGENAEAMADQIIETSEATGLAQEQYDIKSQSAAEQGKRFAATVQTLIQDLGGLASGLGPVLFGLNQLGPVIGGVISPARLLGGALGGAASGIAGGLRRFLTRILPGVVATGAATGTAMGAAAATAEVTTQATGVAAGQAAVGTAAAGPAAAAGGVIGRAMGLAAKAAVLAVPITLAIVGAEIGAHIIEGIRNDITEATNEALQSGSLDALEKRRKDLQQQLRGARASHADDAWVRAVESQIAAVEGAIAKATTRADLSPDARQARDDLHDIAQVALEEHRRGERGESQLASIDTNLTEMQQQLHTDLETAIDTIEASDDPAAVSAAVAAAIKSVLGGVGSGKTTTDLISKLKTELKAAEAANNVPLANQIRAAIAQLEPFAKGRQWQKEQLDKAQSVVDSNKSTADKVAALKGIQADLLSHQRTMAANIVAKQIDTIQAIKGIKINASTGFSTTGPYSEPRKPGAPPPKKPPAKAPDYYVNPDRRAMGGPVSANHPYWVGENRQAELFVPSTSGTIVPMSDINPGGGSGDLTINVPVQGLVRARDPFEIRDAVKRVGDFLVPTPRREPA